MKIFIIAVATLLLLQQCTQIKQSDSNSDTAKKVEFDYKTQEPNTSISGSIENATRSFIVLSQDDFKDTLAIASEGTFFTELSLKKPEYFLFSDGKANIRIFLEPNDKLEISYNAANTFKSIEFKGDGMDANTYLKDKYLLMLDNALNLSELYDLPTTQFKYTIDSLYVISKMFYDEMVAKKNLPKLFKETELAALKYERGTHLLEYLQKSSDKISNTSEYLKFMNELSVNESEHLSIYEYRSYLNAFIDLKSADKIMGNNLYPYEIALIKMQTINGNIENQNVKDYLLYSNLKQHIKYYGFNNSDALFKTFELNCKNQQFLNTALDSYKHYKSLSEVKAAPNFKMYTTQGKQVSLNNFKGTYLYIDVWASWCLPCRKEAPIFEQLKTKYAHKNVAFLSLSIDKTEQEWLEYLEAKHINTEMHFIAKDKKAFLDNYMIQTIPHFLIIDDKGNLIDNNAPRPSEGKTEWLDELPDKSNV